MHLDLVRDLRGHAIYWQPEQFFSRIVARQAELRQQIDAIVAELEGEME